MIIGDQSITMGIQELTALVMKHHSKIDEAYQENDNEVNVALNLKYKRNKHGECEAETTINFVQVRCKDKTVCVVDERQRSLPGME